MKEVLKSMTVDESKETLQFPTRSTSVLANYKEEYKKLIAFRNKVHI
jgi:hypothetical protein